MNEIVWEPILECDDENGNHCCYSTKYNGEFLYISKYHGDRWCIEHLCSDDEYRPVNSDCDNFDSAEKAMEYFETELVDLLDELSPPHTNTGGLKR